MKWRIAIVLFGAIFHSLAAPTVFAQYQYASAHLSDDAQPETQPPAPANIVAAPEVPPTEPLASGPPEALPSSPADSLPYSAVDPPPTPVENGGYLYETTGPWTPPCSFTSYWDYSGGRSPTAYSGAFGYGPDWCNTWQVRAEWLLWFSRGRNTPPLVTSSPASTPPAQAGILGLSTTGTGYGNDPIGQNARHGLRFTLGRVLGDGITTATVRFWGVENGSETYAINSGNRVILARPFNNVSLGTPDAFLVAYPGITSPGNIHILSRNNLFGADAWLSRNLYLDRCCSFSLLGGYQFTRMDDSIVINSSSTSASILSGLPVGTNLSLSDSFRTQNEFHGATIGFLADFRKEWLSVEVLGKVALGDMREFVAINGQTNITPLGGPTATTNSGLYAQPSNIGNYQRHQFAAAPELNINGVWHFNPQWKATIGYSLLYWSNAVLAGNQIDPNLNLTQSPGPIVGAARPAFSFQRADFLVQGINFGVDYCW